MGGRGGGYVIKNNREKYKHFVVYNLYCRRLGGKIGGKQPISSFSRVSGLFDIFCAASNNFLRDLGPETIIFRECGYYLLLP